MNIDIEKLMLYLLKLKANGVHTVQLKGTLMCEKDGNKIIATTEKQM